MRQLRVHLIMVKKNYKHVFFDLDHTLWDYERSSKEALEEIYESYQLDKVTSLDPHSFVVSFHRINYHLWEQYNQSVIDGATLRKVRFRLVLEQFTGLSNAIIDQINETFMEVCPKKSNLIDGALELLEHLQNDYSLHIITNGFQKTQMTKLECCGIIECFKTITTSENAQSKKPDRKIFEYALNVSGSEIEEAIMIGDNLKTDILGAQNFGIDQVYLNPKNTKAEDILPTFSISSLEQLASIL